LSETQLSSPIADTKPLRISDGYALGGAVTLLLSPVVVYLDITMANAGNSSSWTITALWLPIAVFLCIGGIVGWKGYPKTGRGIAMIGSAIWVLVAVISVFLAVATAFE
jgi:hypothetical protein